MINEPLTGIALNEISGYDDGLNENFQKEKCLLKSGRHRSESL